METKTQSPSKLELTLCNLLPYKLFFTDGIHEKNYGLDYDNISGVVSDAEELNCIKPILHSLSKLTEPVLENGEIPIITLARFVDNGHNHTDSIVIKTGGFI